MPQPLSYCDGCSSANLDLEDSVIPYVDPPKQDSDADMSGMVLPLWLRFMKWWLIVMSRCYVEYNAYGCSTSCPITRPCSPF